MPAHPLEIKEAIEEGVKLDILASPQKITPNPNGTLEIEYRKRPVTADIFDFSISIPGTEYVYSCDSVLLAIGQRIDQSVCTSASVPLNTRVCNFLFFH